MDLKQIDAKSALTGVGLVVTGALYFFGHMFEADNSAKDIISIKKSVEALQGQQVDLRLDMREISTKMDFLINPPKSKEKGSR